MRDNIETIDEASSEQAEAEATGAPARPKKLFNLSIRELPLKQAPMEAVIKRET